MSLTLKYPRTILSSINKTILHFEAPFWFYFIITIIPNRYNLTTQYKLKKKDRNTRQSNQRNNQTQTIKDKTITWNNEIQMTGQHDPLWKPEVKASAPHLSIKSEVQKNICWLVLIKSDNQIN